MHVNESSIISENCGKAERRQAVLFSGDLNCRKNVKEFTNETSDRYLQELNLFCCWQLSTLYTCNTFSTYRAPVAGQPEAAPFVPCCSCSLYWTRDAFLKFSLVSHITWWSWQQVSLLLYWTFQLKLIQKWQGSNSSHLARFTGMSLSDLCLCKSVCFIIIRERYEPRVCQCRASERGTVWCDMPTYLVTGLNPRTIPHLSLNKFRASLGYRGLVLGLNVSCFCRSLGTSIGANSTKPAEVADILRHRKLRAVLAHLRPGLFLWLQLVVVVCVCVWWF